MTTVLFWDIDGTLLTTARAGMVAVADGLREIAGVEDPDLEGMRVSGFTDAAVAEAALEHVGHPTDPATAQRLLRAYERALPGRLAERQGGVLPNVRETLELFDPHPDVLNLLLTGNTRAGAKVKLGHYGIDHFFAGGGFSTGVRTRDQIAQDAHDMAAERLGGPPDPDSVFVIGDTPADISCGKAIGARTVAVGTGLYELAELERHDPWLALPELPPPGEFAQLIGVPAAGAIPP